MANNLGTIPNVEVVNSIKVEIDTTPTGQSRTWAQLCAGFSNITEALNEVVNQYFFLCGKGFAANYTTGMAPAYTLTGVRVFGDTAQDYIFGYNQKFGIMNARNTHVRLTRTHPSDSSTEVISFNAMLANITDLGGGTTDGSAVSVELRMQGEPQSGDAWAT